MTQSQIIKERKCTRITKWSVQRIIISTHKKVAVFMLVQDFVHFVFHWEAAWRVYLGKIGGAVFRVYSVIIDVELGQYWFIFYAPGKLNITEERK